MKRTNYRNYRFLKAVGTVALLLYLATGTVICAQDETKTSRGTVNIALANSRGIVLLTDSVQSHKKADGWHHIQPVQKLFRLDDKTVCSIAGFASETWNRPELNTEVTGIIADFQDQLSQHPVPELEAKLRAIGFLVGFYIDLVANRNEVLRPRSATTDTYTFEVIVAGYDVDGNAKLKKLVLTAEAIQATDGHRYWSHTTSPEEATSDHGLLHLLGGIPDVSLQVLNSPEKFQESAAIRKYAQSKKENDGKSLSLDEMAALASEMAAQTAKYPHFGCFVGGPDQIAILAKGRILKLDQPDFPDPPRPLKFAVMTHLQVQGQPQIMPAGADVKLLWIRVKFNGIKNPRLRLDGQFFYGCEIRNSVVEYAGGLTDLGATNSVANSVLHLRDPATPPMLEIMNRFKWSLELPNTTPLPPTISPLPD